MRLGRLRSPSAILLAILIVCGAGWLAWLAYRAAIIGDEPPGSLLAARIAPRSPSVILDSALVEFAEHKGALSAATLARVADAALHAPLDSRPFMFFAIKDILRHDDARALATLEAGRRLDPRDRWIRLLLLDRYLRAHRSRDAAGEFAVLARLVSGAGNPILAQLAQMSLDPATRGAVRQTLANDPMLENELLTKLATAQADPNLVFAMASSHALATAGDAGSWGPVLIGAMVQRGRYAAARAAWKRLYQLPDSLTGGVLYDPGLQGLPGAAPFNWALAAGPVGAVERHAGQFLVNYYGRDTGELASQLLVLTPGRYHFTYVLSGQPAAAGTTLSWTIACAAPALPGAAAAPAGTPLADHHVPPVTPSRRRLSVDFAVPASGCGAQWLRLIGNAGEFPTPISATIEALSLQQAGARP